MPIKSNPRNTNLTRSIFESSYRRDQNYKLIHFGSYFNSTIKFYHIILPLNFAANYWCSPLNQLWFPPTGNTIFVFNFSFLIFRFYFYVVKAVWGIQWGFEYRTCSDFGWSIVVRFQSQLFEFRTMASLDRFI